MKELFEKAISFANEKHKNQKRKGTDFPYIVHIYEVVQILLSNGANLETAIIGALHDTVEDTETTLDEIEKAFGKTIRDGVDTLSENKNLPYTTRKEFQAFRLSFAPIEVKMVKCADCLSNLRGIKNDLTHCDVWAKFNAPKKDIANHYAKNIAVMATDLKNFDMFKELSNLYYDVFMQKEEKHQTSLESENSAKSQTQPQETTIPQKNTPPIDFSSNSKEVINPILKDNIQCCSMANVENTAVTEKQLRYCTECSAMKRIQTPDPHDWFCDDDQTYICGITGNVLSEANRPYEKQIAPKNCPLEKQPPRCDCGLEK